MSHCRKIILFWIVMAVGFTLSCRKPTGPSQPDYTVVWEKAYGTAHNDEGRSILQTSDGGFLIVGKEYSNSSDSSDVLVIRTDSLGDSLWTRTYGFNGIEIGRSVDYASDGGYVITGSTWSSVPSYDLLLFKIDDSGTIMWEKVFDRGYMDHGREVQQTLDGGYIVVGSTQDSIYGGGGIWLLKFDSNGDTLWTRIYRDEAGFSVQQTSDGGYIIGGCDFVYAYILKTDSLGDSLWAKRLGSVSTYDNINSIVQAPDGGFAVAGHSFDVAGTYELVFAAKTDSIGDTLWIRNYGESHATAYSVLERFEGGYAIVGYRGPWGNGDIYLLEVDENGDPMFECTHGGEGSEIGYSFVQTVDGAFVITGSTTSSGSGGMDVYLIKLKP